MYLIKRLQLLVCHIFGGITLSEHKELMHKRDVEDERIMARLRLEVDVLTKRHKMLVVGMLNDELNKRPRII